MSMSAIVLLLCSRSCKLAYKYLQFSIMMGMTDIYRRTPTTWDVQRGESAGQLKANNSRHHGREVQTYVRLQVVEKGVLCKNRLKVHSLRRLEQYFLGVL